MKKSIGILALLLISLSFSANTFAATDAKANLPRTILIKTDANGQIFVHRSNVELKKGDEAKLDQLKFEKLADVASVVKIKNVPSDTQELDTDLPRQSWYVYYGYNYYNYGYYPYYPINYYAYNYNYAYYPYYNYNYNYCNYYYYRY